MHKLTRLYWLVGVLTLADAGVALASEPPPRTYPERFDVPQSTAERDARCAVVRTRSARIRAAMQDGSLISRLNWVRVYERRTERFLEEQCGDVDERGMALSAEAARSGKIVGATTDASVSAPEHHE